MKNTTARLRRAKKTRSTIKRLRAVRVSVHKTNQHIYAQLIDVAGTVLASASTLTKEFKTEFPTPQKKSEAAVWVGEQIAKKAISLGVKEVAFDRSGFQYHGRIMQLANAAREAGLEF